MTPSWPGLLGAAQTGEAREQIGQDANGLLAGLSPPSHPAPP
ncbi:hypothetical protein [Streptomyces sp. NPDC053720]